MNRKLIIPKKAEKNLLADIKELIESARQAAARYVNSSLVLLYWKVGQRIDQELLKQERAEYGEQIVKQLAAELTISYGRGFHFTALSRMTRFARFYSQEKIVATVSQLLSWSHFAELVSLDAPLKREFYTELCRLEHWSVRQLRKKIQSMLYERTALSKQPEKTIQHDLKNLRKENEISTDLAFRDPYILDFLQKQARLAGLQNHA